MKYKTKILVASMLGVLILTSCSNANNELVEDKGVYETVFIEDTPTPYATPIQSPDVKENTERKIPEILSIANNENKYTDLITVSYDYYDLCKFFIYDIDEVNDITKIECLRKVDDKTYYSIQKSTTDGLNILLFKEKDNKWVTSEHWYMETLLFKDDFKNLKIGETLKDVQNIDEYENYSFLYMDFLYMDVNDILVSRHKTIDGYEIIITYDPDFTINEYVIKEISIVKGDEDSIYENLLYMDIEAILATQPSPSPDMSENNKRTAEDILSIADNRSLYSDLLTQTFSNEELLRGRLHGPNIEYFDVKYNIECLRKVDAKHCYAILKDSEKGILILLFTEKNNEWEASEWWYMKTLLFKDSFKDLKIGDTQDDVCKVDQYGENMHEGWNLASSLHQTIDGYTIKISYENGSKAISEISIVESDKNSIYANLLPMDIKTIKEELGKN